MDNYWIDDFVFFSPSNSDQKFPFLAISGNEQDKKKNEKGQEIRETIPILPEFHEITHLFSTGIVFQNFWGEPKSIIWNQFNLKMLTIGVSIESFE